MKYDKIIQHKWKGEGVKFLKKPLGWDKNYLRTANCKYCGKKAKEKFVNESFYGWALLPIASSVDGKHPEVCPECLNKMGMNLVVNSPRIQRCTKCGSVQKEKIFGLGWPGWVGLQSMKVLGKKTAPLLCPDCFLELAKNLGAEYIRGTWTDITYPFGSLLTSTKMTQNQANFTALAEGHAGAPDIIGAGLSNPFIFSNPFIGQSQLLHVQDEKAAGTNGGSFISGAWRTRTLNTLKTNEITGASLAANQITLPAGTYWIEFTAPANQVDQHKAIFYNITDASNDIIGTSEFCDSVTFETVTHSKGMGKITIADIKVFELRHQCSTSKVVNGFGVQNNFGVNEIYSIVKIFKTA